MSYGRLNAALVKCVLCDGDNGIAINADGRLYKKSCPACKISVPGKLKELKEAKCPRCRQPLAGEASSVQAYDSLVTGLCKHCRAQRDLAAGGVSVNCRECGQTFIVPVSASNFRKALALPVDFDAKPFIRSIRSDKCSNHEQAGIKPPK